MSEHYEWIKADASRAEDAIGMTYRVKGGSVNGSMSHEEDTDFTEWTDDQIESLVRDLLGVESDDPVEIEIIR